MKKIYRLASAEIKKIFSRPFVLLFMVVLIGAIFINSINFEPTITTNKLTYNGLSVGQIYDEFIDDTNITQFISSTNIKSVKLENARTKLQQQINVQNSTSNKFTNLKNKVENIYADFNQTSESSLRAAILAYTTNPPAISKTDLINAFVNVKTKANEIYNYMLNNFESDVNFYLTKTDKDKLLKFFKDFKDAFPANTSDYTNYTKEVFIGKYEYLSSTFSISEHVYPITNSLVKIEINQNYMNEIEQSYYNEANVKLAELINEIDTFYIAHSASTTSEDLETISNHIANFNSIANMNANIINNELLLAKASDLSDTYLQKCVDFDNFRRFELHEEITINKYLLENNLYDYEILRNFNYNKSSGPEINAFDFAFSSVQICMILITLFSLFCISSLIADEQKNGTIKLLAIRPISRNKIVSGKYLATVIVSLLFLVFSTLCSFGIGMYLYGVPNIANVVVCFNATTAIAMNPILLFGIYLLSCLINICFFVSIAMFVAMLTRSGIATIFVGAGTFLASLIMNANCMSNSWFKFFAFPHLDLFKFFGNTSSGFLTMSLLPDMSLILSASYIGATIIILNIISHTIFLNRDIA